jgi:hypothetical protein
MLPSWSRTCLWWWGAKTETIRLMLSGLSGQDGRLDRIQVTHFSDQNDVRVLAKGRPQASRETADVHPNLSLADRALFVLVQVLDRVFDGDDILPAMGVDVIDHRGQRRGLAASGRSGHEHEPSLEQGDLFQHLGKEQLPDRLDIQGDDPQGNSDRPALLEDAPPEPPEPRQAVGQVDVKILLEPVLLVVGHELISELLSILGGQPRKSGESNERSMNADNGMVSGFQMKVGGIPLDCDF